uniref:Solute carrier family 40 member n=1 Tax=Plectus sambesii TaxID=2011161 RepID=A0A914UTK1_9BILA
MPSQSFLTRAEIFFRSPSFKFYCSYTLSTWSDSWWQFTLSLALFEINGNLRFIAINGLVDGLAVLFFASSVGKWIDETKRITATRTTLTITNGSVALSAICLAVIQHWDTSGILDGSLRFLLIVLAILLSTVAVLAQTGTKIALTKDWLVVICNNEKDKLANMNAWLLRVNLTTRIISPLIAGLLMRLVSVSAGCLLIAIWTLCSWGVEFWLLNVVYKSVPALAVKKSTDFALEIVHPSSVGLLESESTVKLEHTAEILLKVTNTVPDKNCSGKFGSVLTATFLGWRSYYRQPVFPAALSLALLFLTVLDFHGITTGYAYSQGLPTDVLAIARGVAALMGIIGSVIYPFSRSKIGLARTGLVSFLLDLLCLALCVLSIWLPGSHFDPIGYFSSPDSISPTEQSINTTLNIVQNSTELAVGITKGNQSGYSYCSISTFLLGVILARCGLYMADLSIIQIMQESIAEHERGVVNGVQSSVNRLLSMMRDLLVIVLPDPRTFGLLIIISWLSILSGFLSYSVYSCRIRGLNLPFHRQFSAVLCRNVSPDDRDNHDT